MPANGPYDQDLLASAPAATKAQLQEGYTTDLLDHSHGKSLSSHPAQSEQSPVASQTDREQGSPAKELNGYISSTKPVPFWRTTKGIVIIAVVIIVVLGAVIGGAVGGTQKAKGNATNTGTATIHPGTTVTNPITSSTPTLTNIPGGGQSAGGGGGGGGQSAGTTTASPGARTGASTNTP